MSTPATIGYYNEQDKTYHYVYLHCDGFINEAGLKLLKHYNSLDLAKELVRHGNISVLGESIYPPNGSKHSFNTPVKGVCIFYHRDRTDDLQVNISTQDPTTCEFVYIFKDGVWNVKLCKYNLDINMKSYYTTQKRFVLSADSISSNQ